MTVLLIVGMRGSQCRERLVAALESVAGVTTADVNLYRARATVVHDPRCDSAELIRAVARAGYWASLPEDGCGSESRGVRSERRW